MLLYIIRKLFIKPLSAYHFHKVFFKGIRRKLRWKKPAFSEHFHSKGQVPLKNVGFTLSNVPYPLKFVSSIRRRALFLVHNLFKWKSSPISSTLRWTFSFEEIMYVRWAFFGSLHKLEMFCHSFQLQRPLRGDHNFFKINSKNQRKMFAKRCFFLT